MSASNLINRYDGALEKEDFFSLVHHIQRIHGALESNSVGEDTRPNEELVRFKTKNTLGFDVDYFKQEINPDGSNRYDMFVSFIGLLGVSGVLPKHYTKISLEQIKKGDSALSEFVGLFEHRLISLYYRAWAKTKHAIQFESKGHKGRDGFSTLLKSFTGELGSNTLPLHFSGHFSKTNRPLSNLKKIVSTITSADVKVESLTGRWLPINRSDRCVIGVLGKNNRLGDGLIVGNRYWDIQSKITIVLSNLTMSQYLQWVSGQPLSDLLHKTIRSYVPSHIDVDFKFKVNSKKSDIKKIGEGLQLSKNTWLMSRKEKTLIATQALKHD